MARLRAINPDAEFRYVLEDDRKNPPEEQIIWWLKPLKSATFAAIQDGYQYTEQVAGVGGAEATLRTHYANGNHILRILREGLSRVENFVDDDDNPVVIPLHRAAMDGFIDRLLASWKAELSLAIVKRTEVTEDDRKNSDSPSRSALPVTAEPSPVLPNGAAASASEIA